VFDWIDVNNDGEIDFNEFCNINSDKQKSSKASVPSVIKRPPLAGTPKREIKFIGGLIPKCKNINRFTQEIMEPTMAEAVRLKRRDQSLPSRNDLNFTYGHHNSFNHNMLAIVSNAYKEDRIESNTP